MSDRQKIADALNEIRFLSEDLSEENLEEFLELCIAVGRLEPAKLHAELEKADSRSLIEPLIVALRILKGEDVSVAQEILEVARDLVSQLSTSEDAVSESASAEATG